MDFIKFKQAVAARFEEMKTAPLFRTGATKDDMWDTYLSSFPAGSNPMYRERTEHDCSCCKQFIRAIGNVVSLVDGKMTSIWDCKVDDPNYQAVADGMASFVKSHSIENIFLHTEHAAGVHQNIEHLMEGKDLTWSHFFVNIPSQYVCSSEDLGTKLSHSASGHDVMFRSLVEITPEAIETVLELISQNSLYRGEEHLHNVEAFKALKEKFDTFESFVEERDYYVWENLSSTPEPVRRIRNTSIGQLLTNLSDGKDLEEAVKIYEAIVAPANYKRPTAIVSKAMVERAQAQIEELGLTSALERRYATLEDVSVNDILFADRQAKSHLKGGSVFDDIAREVPASAPKNLDKVEEIPIEKFLADVLPKAESLELMIENSHLPNLMSIVAPVDPTAGKLFTWDNNFSWAYSGDVTDSIKERVKAAGGNVTGDLCCRLAWNNFDDLDLHMREPNRMEIFYGNKKSRYTGGELDVDMNAGGPRSRNPVENIFYGNRRQMVEGRYVLYVNQYSRREMKDEGFEVEIDYLGTVYKFAYSQPMPTGKNVTVAEFDYTHAGGLKMVNSMPSTTQSKESWGIHTNQFSRVNLVMLSPNHWHGTGVGNKHYFFILADCQNPDSARGFFNEFLRNDLKDHRKVFEIVGNRMRAPHVSNQLSGLGFSSTVRNHVLCKVTGAFTRTVKITF